MNHLNNVCHGKRSERRRSRLNQRKAIITGAERCSGEDERVSIQYLGHVDNSHRQRFVAQDGSVFVAFPSLQHDLKSVGIPLKKMGVLKYKEKERKEQSIKPLL